MIHGFTFNRSKLTVFSEVSELPPEPPFVQILFNSMIWGVLTLISSWKSRMLVKYYKLIAWNCLFLRFARLSYHFCAGNFISSLTGTGKWLTFVTSDSSSPLCSFNLLSVFLLAPYNTQLLSLEWVCILEHSDRKFPNLFGGIPRPVNRLICINVTSLPQVSGDLTQ